MDRPPPSSSDSSRAFELAVEYHAAVAVGQTPDLAALCDHDSHLIDAVRSVLHAGERVSSVGHAAEPALPVAGPAELPSRYDLGEEIGRGGMGVVFAGRDTSLDRDIAVKLLRPDRPVNASVVRRFTEEAKVTAQLQHPGIPAVHELGTLADGRPFLAMKLIRGKTLAALLKEKGYGSGRWLGVFESICQAVGAAHSNGVIHRDLKPGNVMVGAFGEVQVMDWGLAKRVGDPASGPREGNPVAHASRPPGEVEADTSRGVGTPATDTDEIVTKAGTILGTPAYMAPEQARGEIDAIDRRTDVFALGAILCELLTGKPPLPGKTADVIAAASVGNFADALSRLDGCGEDTSLIALCKRCLSANPLARPMDASEVAVAVASFRGEAESRAKRAEVERGQAETRATETRKRQRVQAWLGGVAAAFLLAAVVGTSVGLVLAIDARRREQNRADEAEDARAKTEQAYSRAAGVLDVMTSELSGNSLFSQTVVTAEQKAFLSQVLGYYQELLGENATDERGRFRMANAAYRVAQIQYRLGRFREAVEAFHTARDLTRGLAADQPAVDTHTQNLSQIHNYLGLLLVELGELSAAEEEYKTALSVQSAASITETARTHRAMLHNNLGSLYRKRGQLAAAGEQYQAALALRKELVAAHPESPECRQYLAATHHNLGLLAEMRRRWADAEEHCAAAIRLYEPLVDTMPGTPAYRLELARSRQIWGNVLTAVNRRDEAEKQYRSAQLTLEKLVNDFPTVPEYRLELSAVIMCTANLLTGDGKTEGVEKMYRRAGALCQGVLDESPDVPQYLDQRAMIHHNFGMLLEDLNRPSEAEKEYHTAADIREKLVQDHPNGLDYRAKLANTNNNMVGLLYGLGKRAEAQKRGERAHALYEGLVADPSTGDRYAVDLGNCCINVGLLGLNGPNPADSLRWFNQAVETLGPISRRDQRDVAAKGLLRKGHRSRAIALDLTERSGEAVADWELAIELSGERERPPLLIARTRSKVRAGRVEDAVRDVQELVRATNWPPANWCDFATVYATASAGITDKKDEYADRAMELLTKAVKAGFKDTARLRDDLELDPIRGRDDFKALVAELEKKFPPKKEVLPPPRADK